MSKKKIILAVVAIVLALTATFAGSLAFLTAKTNQDTSVVNTFTAASGILDPNDPTFKIEENEVILSDDGSAYTLVDGELTQSNTYNEVIAGMTIAKNPMLTINLKTNISAYVFVEVVDTLDDAYTYELSSCLGKDPLENSKGEKLVGANGGDIYLVTSVGDVKAEKITGKEGVELNAVELIKDNTIKVGNSIKDSDLGTLNFYAYACQSSGFETAAAAFDACFNN